MCFYVRISPNSLYTICLCSILAELRFGNDKRIIGSCLAVSTFSIGGSLWRGLKVVSVLPPASSEGVTVDLADSCHSFRSMYAVRGRFLGNSSC